MSVLRTRTSSPRELLQKLHKNNLPIDQSTRVARINATPAMRKKLKARAPRVEQPDMRTPQKHMLRQRRHGDTDNTTYHNHRGWGDAAPSEGNYYAGGGYVNNDTPQGRPDQASYTPVPYNLESYDDQNPTPPFHQTLAPQMFAWGGGVQQPWGQPQYQAPHTMDLQGSGLLSRPQHQEMQQPSAGWQVNPNRNNGGTYAASTSPYQNGMYIRAPQQQPQAPQLAAPPPARMPSNPGGAFRGMPMSPPGGMFAHGGVIGSRYPHHYASGGWADMLGNLGSKAMDYGTKFINNPTVQKYGQKALEKGMPLAMGAMQGGLDSWQNGGSFGQGMKRGAFSAMDQSEDPYMQMASKFAQGRGGNMNQMASQFGQRALEDSGFGDTQWGRGANAAMDAYGRGAGAGEIARHAARGSGNQYAGMAADFMENPRDRNVHTRMGNQFLDDSGFGDTQMGRGARSAMGSYGRGGNMRDMAFEGAIGALPQNEWGEQMGGIARRGKDMYDEYGRGGGGGGGGMGSMRDQFTTQNAGKYGLEAMKHGGKYLSNMQNPNARNVGRAMQQNYLPPPQQFDDDYDDWA